MLTVKFIFLFSSFPFFPIQITPQLILTLHLPFCAPGAVIAELAQHGQESSTLMEALAALPGGLSDKQHLLRYMTVNELSALPAFAKAEQGNVRGPFAYF